MLAEWQLRADVVEKDYVLGWLRSAGLGTLPVREDWIFKGGTAIKKCDFETYRFSEDLDFSLLPKAAHGEDEIKEILMQLARVTGEMSGIVFPHRRVWWFAPVETSKASPPTKGGSAVSRACSGNSNIAAGVIRLDSA